MLCLYRAGLSLAIIYMGGGGQNRGGSLWPCGECSRVALHSAFLSQFYWATKGRHLLFASMIKMVVYQKTFISMFLN